MNKLIFKKILYDYLTFFIISLLSASIIVWVFQAVNYLDIIAEDGKNFITYINYSLLNFTKITSRLFSFILFFSFFYILIKYENSNELLIFWNFGINKIELVYFFFYFSIILMFFQIVLTSLIVPNSLKYSKKLMNESNFYLLDGFIKPKNFNDTIKGLTIYSDNQDENGNLINIFIKKNVGKNSFQITYAEKGKLREKPNNVLELYNGETVNNVNGKLSKFEFMRSDFSLNKLESNTVQYIKMQETPSTVILSCINKLFELNIYYLKNIDSSEYALKCSSSSLENIFKELYKRFVLPLYIPVLILITSILLIYSKENKNYSTLKVIIFLINFFIIIFSEISIKVIDNQFNTNVALFLTPILLMLIIFISLKYNLKLRFNKTLK